MANYPKVNYIGNKEKLVGWILDEFPIRGGTVLDLFSGGGSVSYELKKRGFRVLANDILYADYVIAQALLANSSERLEKSVFGMKADEEEVKRAVSLLGFLAGRLYYPEEIGELARLHVIAESLEGGRRYLFLALLRRAMIRKLPYSRMNVPWNQIERLRDEDYSYKKYGRKRAYHNQTFESHMLENIDAYNRAVFDSGQDCAAYCEDAAVLISRMEKVDAVYLDPPYPSTMNRYDDFYGLFDDMFGMRREHMDFTRKQTFLQNMEQLIVSMRGRTEYVVISQNSRVKPAPEEMEAMLGRYGQVVRKEKKHNYQVTGKENKNGSREILFLLKLS